MIPATDDAGDICAHCDSGGLPGAGADAAKDATEGGYPPPTDDSGHGVTREAGTPDTEAPIFDAGEREAGLSDHVASDTGVEPNCTDCDQTCEESVPISSATHIEGDIDYPSLPPAGGDHNGCWAPWGVHDLEVRPENWVHNLEHGGVILLYNCEDDCPTEVAALTDFSASHGHTLLTPYAELPGRFAAVSWGHRLVSSCLDMDAIAAFYTSHVDRAPESVTSDPPTSCR